ncbi:acyl carrier protein [Streptomyces maoxianensis]|uniref:Acyl carrier protein n=1 Tax=Streptomyces maoxianensis TaxID=1459942 RepID=A0ABV9FZU7_9ACTN
MDSVVQYISEVLSSKFDIPADFITPTTDFETLDLDSLVLVELAVILNKEYGVEIGDDELKEAQTIANTAALVLQKGAGVAA